MTRCASLRVAGQAGAALEAAAAEAVTAGGWHAFQETLPVSDSSRAVRQSPSCGKRPDRDSEASRPPWSTGSPPLSASRDRPSDAPPETPPVVAVTTANVWAKTQLMMHSLAAVRDPFELLVITLVPKPAQVPVCQSNWIRAYSII